MVGTTAVATAGVGITVTTAIIMEVTTVGITGVMGEDTVGVEEVDTEGGAAKNPVSFPDHSISLWRQK